MIAPAYTSEDLDLQEEPSPSSANQILRDFGRRLGRTDSVLGVAEILLEAADELFGWDAASFDLCSAGTGAVEGVLTFDVVDGNRQQVPVAEPGAAPSRMMQRTMERGAQLLLRDMQPRLDPELAPFGDVQRAAASLMFVPLCGQSRALGVVTIQSYSPSAYSQADLETLQLLADLAAGAVERVRAQDRLRRTEELYRRAIGGAGAVPYIYDFRTRSYSFIGEGIAQLTGYSPKEINGQVWAQLIQESTMAGEAAGLDKKEAARQVESGKIRDWRCDMRIVTRDGKSRWLSDASVQDVDPTGRVIGSMGILEDISERKQAELSALALSRLGQSLASATTLDEAVRCLLDAADALFGWDACAFYLYSADKDCVHPVMYMDTVEGKRVQVAPPATECKPSRINRRVIENGAELTLKDAAMPAMDADGTPFGDVTRPSLSIMRVPLRLRTNRVTGIFAVHSYAANAYSQKDLKTLQSFADYCGVALERIWANEALRQSESQLRLVWESSADGMRLLNRDGFMLRVNDAFCRMVKKPRAELEGQLLTAIHSEANAAFVLESYRQRVDSRSLAPHLETEVVLWNGSRVWFELSSSLLEMPGKPPLVLSLFRDITARKQTEAQLAGMHQQLLEVSRQAGMAEVATSVLHNVGNVLNSVNVSTSLIADKVRTSKAPNLAKAVALLQQHPDDLAGFLKDNPKGRQLADYLSGLAEHLAAEQEGVAQELKSLAQNIDHIKEIIAMQQSYARVVGVVESLPVVELVEDALRLNAGAMERHQIKVIREYFQVPPILVDKHKVLQILVNLIRNAKYALDDREHADKRLVLQVGINGNGMVKIAVIDNGIGIRPELLTRIFEHGFTTRKQGHGFGLHNGALAAKELGGSLTACSDGPGKGARFILELPLRPRDPSPGTDVGAKRSPGKLTTEAACS